MAQRLKNIVRFTGLTPNVATSLPHGLETSLGRPLVPDLLAPSLEGAIVTADDTNITVTVNALAVDVWCESWHTIERSFGDSADQALVPQPFVLGGAGGGADVQSFNNFVLRPGGVPGNNVYITWAALYAALSLVQGYKTIQFDTTLGAITIPAGVYDMTDTEWFATGNHTATQQGVFTSINLADGAQFTNLIKIGGTLRIFNLNTTQAAIVLTAATTFVVMDIGMSETGPGFPVISSSAGGPFIDASALPLNAVFVVRLQGQLLGTSAFIDFGAATARFDMVVFDYALVAAGVLRSGVNASLFVIYGGAGTVLRQAGWLGPFFPSDMFRLLFGALGGPADLPLLRTQILPRPASQVQTAPSTVAFATIDLITNTTWRFNTVGGNIAQTLPAVRSNPADGSVAMADGAMEGTGTILIIKNFNATNANTVDLTPNGAETIDGVAAPISVPAGGSRILQSDGISDWIIIGGYL